jgi:hypothetical protein
MARPGKVDHFLISGHTLDPYMECYCGWTSSATATTWESVGAEMDQHLFEEGDE